MHARLLILLAACQDKGSPLTDTATPDTDTAPVPSDDTADTDTPVTWTPLTGSCEAPDGLGEHPLTLVGEDQHIQEIPGSWFMEMVDVEADRDRGLVYGAGQGGLTVFDVSDAAAPVLIGSNPERTANIGRYYRVEVGTDEVVFATHRDRGMTTFDASDPERPEIIGEFGPPGLEGMALLGDLMYVTNLYGGLHTIDVSDPSAPVGVDELSGLGSPWDIVLSDSGSTGYISDSQLGVVPVDLSDARAPLLADPVTVGGVQDIALSGAALYAAAGGVGVVVMDITDPLQPVVVTTLDYAGSIQSVAVQDDVLWAVNQEDVIAIDIGDPLNPIPLGTSTTPEFAMHVGAGDGVAWVGDWSRLEAWQVDPSIASPDLELSISTILLDGEGDTLELTVYNVGAAELSLTGAESGDKRLTVDVTAMDIAPGGAAQLRLTYAGGADALLTSLCLASTDPDAPTQLIEVHSGSGGNHDAIGQPAPDFVLPDLDGNTWQLSEQLGAPVVLVYFATW